MRGMKTKKKKGQGIYCLFLYVWKLGLSHEGKNVGWGCWRKGAEEDMGHEEEEVIRDEFRKVIFSAHYFSNPATLHKLASYKTSRILFKLQVQHNWELYTAYQYCPMSGCDI